MTWGGIASAAVGAGVSIYSANKQKSAAKNAAQATAPSPYGVSTPFGTMSNNNGVLGYNMGQNPFATMFQNVGMAGLSNAATAPGSFLNGASPELAAAYQGLTGPGIQEAASGRYDLLNQLAQPEMQRSQNQLQDTLFAQGRGRTRRIRRIYSASWPRRIGPLLRPRIASKGRCRLLDRAKWAR
jgi:hypothetical protein